MNSLPLEVINLSKSFGGARPLLWRKAKAPTPAVRNVSFRIERGEIYGMIGANGSGKSTLVRMVRESGSRGVPAGRQGLKVRRSVRSNDIRTSHWRGMTRYNWLQEGSPRSERGAGHYHGDSGQAAGPHAGPH